jgi:hypothetical protein
MEEIYFKAGEKYGSISHRLCTGIYPVRVRSFWHQALQFYSSFCKKFNKAQV